MSLRKLLKEYRDQIRVGQPTTVEYLGTFEAVRTVNAKHSTDRNTIDKVQIRFTPSRSLIDKLDPASLPRVDDVEESPAKRVALAKAYAELCAEYESLSERYGELHLDYFEFMQEAIADMQEMRAETSAVIDEMRESSDRTGEILAELDE